MLIFVVNIRPARNFWNSTHCLLSPFTLDWSRNLWHNPMWNMAVNNISYLIYPLSTRTEKGHITKMIPFFFCSVYIKYALASPLLLLTWIYFYRSGGAVNFILPFMTNVTISISISPIVRSWVAIYQLRPLWRLYLTAYTICPGLLLVWMFYSEGDTTFK